MQEQVIALIMSQSWLALSAFAVGAVVRAMKSGYWPNAIRIDAKWRPLVAIGLGILSGVLETMVAGTPWHEAMLRGANSAAIAIVGHVLGIEWLRGGRELGSEVVKTSTFGALVFLLGCSPAAWATGLGFLGSAIDAAAAGAEVFNARHPNSDREDAIRQAELAARAAHLALEAVRARGEDDAAAKAKAVEAYGKLRQLLDETGVIDAQPPAGGAESESSHPVPLELPTAEEVETRL